jgi:hypothetical protein
MPCVVSCKYSSAELLLLTPGGICILHTTTGLQYFAYVTLQAPDGLAGLAILEVHKQ